MARKLKTMPTSPLNVVIQHLLTECGSDGDGMTDGELLARFVRSRDEDALARLVHRHASMVWGVCRRLLNHHDAEDAFQATFFVLVRKAPDVPAQAVANWLYGVARQTAVREQATAAKGGRRETQVVNMPEPTVAEDCDADLQRVVDEELSRLPDHYRGVVVLCDLEGVTRKEAARQLGIPEGSVASRLARARVMLAKRFAQRGIVFSGPVAVAAVVVEAGSVAASARPALVASTIKAASLLAAGHAAGVVSVKVAALAEGVMTTMFMTKFKSVLAVVMVVGLTLGGIGLGVGLPTNPAAVAQAETVKDLPVKKDSPTPPVATKKDENPPQPKGAKQVEKTTSETQGKGSTQADMEALRGTWRIVSGKWEPELLAPPGKEQKKVKETEWTVRDGFTVKGGFIDVKDGTGGIFSITFGITAEKAPREIWVNPHPVGAFRASDVMQGIYMLDGDEWKICLRQSPPSEDPLKANVDRPKEFAAKRAVKVGDYEDILLTLKRVDPKQPTEKK